MFLEMDFILDETEKNLLNEINTQELLKQTEDPYKIPESGIRLRPGEEENPITGIDPGNKDITSLLEQESELNDLHQL